MQYRVTPHMTTGSSSVVLLLGCWLRTRLDAIKLKLSCWDRKRTMTSWELEGIHSQRQIECFWNSRNLVTRLHCPDIESCLVSSSIDRQVDWFKVTKIRLGNEQMLYPTHRQRGMMMMMSLSLPRLYLSLYQGRQNRGGGGGGGGCPPKMSPSASSSISMQTVSPSKFLNVFKSLLVLL